MMFGRTVRRWRGGCLGLVLVGCASEGTRGTGAIGVEPYPPPGLPHRVASSHVELYWKCGQPEPGRMTVDGVARNPWSPQEIRYLEFDLVGIDTAGRIASHAHATAPNVAIGTNQTTRFRLAAGTTGREIRYDLYYEYRFQDPEDQARLAGPPMAPRLAPSPCFGT